MIYPKTNRDRAALYLKAMTEIRERLRCIDELLPSRIAPLLIDEFCYLQLRLTCECLAIACLAAQGDFATHKAFRDRYEPGVIFKALEGLYPAFFPTPSVMQSTGEGSWHFDEVGHGNSITRDEIEQIWNISGDHLHRGSAKRYLQDEQNIDLLGITKLKVKIWNLMMDHILVLSDHKSRFHVSMARDGENIRCYYLFLDMESGIARVEAYDAQIGDTGHTIQKA